MPLYDFLCSHCDTTFEEIVPVPQTAHECPKCQKNADRILSGTKQLTTIIPSYPGCKKKKAGYIHTHGDKKATKIQSGYGGCVSP
jgi:putative FmdB family regulatory protein